VAHLLLVVLVLYVIALAALYAMQRRLIFPIDASASGQQPSVAGMISVRCTSADGVTVAHWYSPPLRGHPVAVLFHGNGGTVADLQSWALALRARGYGILLTDYRGYSGNPGAPSEQGLYADARAALAWLRSEGIGDAATVIIGWSLGSGVGVQMALEHHPSALVLLAPYSSLPDVAAPLYPIFPVRALIRDRFDNVRKIADVGAPVMIVHGAMDPVVPVELGRKLFEAAADRKELFVVPNSGHWIDPSVAFDRVNAFLVASLAHAGEAARTSGSDRDRQSPPCTR
jgi:uncharacterized protein